MVTPIKDLDMLYAWRADNKEFFAVVGSITVISFIVFTIIVLISPKKDYKED
jgi:ABC-type transport system involved in Fe-S cluster assembly fused permease/ATPase subunit